MTSFLFISYASEDQGIALEVCALLEAQGVHCWIAPRDVIPGAKWDEAIVDAITSAGAFLLILTSAANESPYVGNEVNHAFAAKKPIFTFRAEDVQPSKSIGFYLARHHWTDGFAAPLEQTMPQLATALTALLGTNAGAVPPAGVVTQTAAGQTRKARSLARAPLKADWRRRAIGAGAAALAAAAFVALGALWGRAQGGPAPAVARFGIPYSAAGMGAALFSARLLAISPDGTRIVYRTQDGLTLRMVDRLDPVQLVAATFPRSPFFSPDGQWVGFVDDSDIRKVSVAGGASIVVSTGAANIVGVPAWSEDDTIVFATLEGIWRVAAAGGKPNKLASPQPGEVIASPSLLPGGTMLLYTAKPASAVWSQATIVAQSLETGTRTDLLQGFDARYLPPGYLVFGHTSIMVVPFDLRSMRVEGEPIPAVNGVSQAGILQVAVSATGTLLYLPAGFFAARTLGWVDRDGREEAIPVGARGYQHPRISPDGTRVAVDAPAEGGVWIWDVARRLFSRLTTDQRDGVFIGYPVWSPDSRMMFFTSQDSGVRNLFRQPADGTGMAERLTSSDNLQHPHAATPDGRALIFREGLGAGADIRTLALDGSSSTSLVVGAPAGESAAALSRDGRWLAYQSDQSGRDEIYVRPYPDVNGGRWQVSLAGGKFPAWSGDGRELFYMTLDDRLMGVPVEMRPAFTIGEEREILPARYYSGVGTSGRPYDVSPDGRRFLVIKEQARAQDMMVVLNWVEEVKGLVGK